MRDHRYPVQAEEVRAAVRLRVEPIPEHCPQLASLRAELLALPEVVRCVDDARPYRPYFPYGAPDRD